MEKMQPRLQTRHTAGAAVAPGQGELWRLVIPEGRGEVYRLAQLDDYAALPRRRLPWKPPLQMRLKARVSAPELPGTWGFGLWNDPFSLSLGLGGMGRRSPTLPNAAWFFYASQPNYLSFRDDLPAQGLLAATFASPRLPVWMAALGALSLPLALAPPLGRLARGAVRRLVRQGAALVQVDLTEWHAYSLEWMETTVEFRVDGEAVCATPAAPRGPLGLVLWIDNQYAAWTPDGRLRYGFLPNPQPAWLEIVDLTIEQS
jgi:hypothetical protein